MHYHADVARWISAIAGALLSLAIAAHVGTARAQPADEVPGGIEEPMVEHDATSEQPDDSLPSQLSEATDRSQDKPGATSLAHAAPRPITPADNDLIKCVAGCVGRVGGGVVNLSSNETR